MSVRLRLSAALLFALLMVLFSAGAAVADEGSPQLPGATLDAAIDALPDLPAGEPAETGTPEAGTGPADSPGTAGGSAGAATDPAPANGTTTPPADEPSGNSATADEFPFCDAPDGDLSACLPTCEELPEELGVDCSALPEFPAPGECLEAGEFAVLFEELAAAFEGLTEVDLRDALAELGVTVCEPVEEPETGTPAPVKPIAPAPQSFTYANCDDARAHGAAPVHAGQYGYGPHLDSDSDGVGCEESTTPVAQPVTQPVAHASTGKLAYTGVEVQPLVAWGALFLLTGGGLAVAGRRKA